ncbi:peptidase M14 [Bacillus sp. LL01]|uniref:M14 family metallopeptidase n=1 Tax=Bacillus sp. LL01 TaxID=1665556 RepID=UPI00064D4D74|nr:M14 family metallopeptidase [Bacillus sp. LL01]KMJ60108.1 peptidase M14 [Bacillus sp. LL01]
MKVVSRRGDTLWYFSQIFDIPLQLVVDSNKDLSNGHILNKGKTIFIPGYIQSSYEVKNGDTLQSIIHQRRIPMDCISLMNQEKKLSRLKVGEVIRLPDKVLNKIVTPKKKYDYHTLVHDLNRLKVIYPFMDCTSIGQSVMGKPLHHVRIGNGPKKIHWNGSFHANEWITSAVIMNLLNDYLLALTNGNQLRGLPCLPLYEQTELSIVPMVNPDGVDLVLNGPPNLEPFRQTVVKINQERADFMGWKANIRGVDLNKHFPANWMVEKTRKEEKVPSPRDYPGDTPLTEPEALAMSKLAAGKHFDRVIAVHTQGEEFYWGYEGLEPLESKRIALEFERVSTYKNVQYIDSHAGFKDWFIQEFNKPGFTLELGKGINPLPLSQYDTIYPKTLGIFLASLYM